MNPLRFVAFLMVTASFPVLVCRESQAQTTGQSLPVAGVQFASGVHSDSQPPTAESLAVKLDELRAQHRLPAIWIGHFTSQPTSPSPTKLLMVSGVRNATNGQSALPQDIVHLGSCTKSMTAVLIGQLCTEGKLSLDDTLEDVFQDDELVKESAWAKTTIRELLWHRSGAPKDLLLFYRVLDRKHPDSVRDARRALLHKMLESPRPTSREFNYSNMGYILLGHIVEHIEQRDWEAAISERLFKPLKMATAGFGPVGLPDNPEGSPDDNTQHGVMADRAWGHTVTPSLTGLASSLFGGDQSTTQLTPNQIDNARCLGPAGRVHVSLEDWSKYVLCFCQPDGFSRLGISETVFDDLLKPNSDSKDQYAAGWILFDSDVFGSSGLFHNGSNTTWYSYAVAMPERGECILVATNVYSDGAAKTCDQLARLLAAPPNEDASPPSR